ncbi:ScbR family autoregulator-binding transcription factor [Lentzea sp. DG1S-22]|uniref:ScbR family autoregulator-binding transcription factor n=1 Tax=unclassified Lentzea TaxID=2643253 RepID=UPI001F4178E8|nr:MULTISPECIES: ScbR family autoregulator-binding transcription factor [unclassified Lentzea]MCG8922715.1 TetR/AcrR family transcriptional regulator [Lentzea sp. CC55]WVH81228.1 ScbR family autoregulator-binding transcription factor [Lentzea sp. DG1S-22]
MSAKRERATHTRTRLLQAAAEVFDREGFAGSSLTAVCARADVSKGALYCHFRSKEALGVAIIEEQSLLWHRLRDEVLEVEASPVQALITMSFEFVRRLETDLTVRVSAKLLREAVFFDVVAAAQVIGWVTVVRDLLTLARDRGELRPEVNLRHAAEQIVAELLGLQFVAQALSGGTDLRVRLGRVWRATSGCLVTDAVREKLSFG